MQVNKCSFSLLRCLSAHWFDSDDNETPSVSCSPRWIEHHNSGVDGGWLTWLDGAYTKLLSHD